jgi:hypothetical protein
VPLLNMLKTEEEPFEFVFPRQGPIDTLSQGIDGFMKQTFSPSLRFLPTAGILFDGGGFLHDPPKECISALRPDNG